MNILALDTATRTGWAVYAGGVITSGVVDCSIRTKATKTIPSDHPGKRFALFNDWLRNKLKEDKIDIIVYEAVVGGMAAGGNTSLIQKGLEAILMLRSFDLESPIPVWSFSAATIKKWATGSGILTHESKIKMVNAAYATFKDQRAELIPHAPTKSKPWSYDDNQCDALWILDLSLSVYLHIVNLDVNTQRATPDVSSDDVIDSLTRYAQLVTNRKWMAHSRFRHQ